MARLASISTAGCGLSDPDETRVASGGRPCPADPSLAASRDLLAGLPAAAANGRSSLSAAGRQSSQTARRPAG